ncbi:MAG: Crp/Fnr family transcriptional regulator [Candidatus Dadabacteria bacterium]|nr:MAG: Crp/Fnr family transcriptional regulator [Candidatus Dadabacteria bacterium]
MTLAPDELRGVPLFAGLDPEQLERVRAIARLVEAKRRDVIFREGDPVEGIFVLLSGRVKLYRLGPDGREHILHVVRPGQTFAEAAVFMPGGYPAFAEALEKTRAIVLPKAAFLALLREEPAISLAMIAALSRYLRQFVDRIDDLSLKDVPARLARWFLATAREKGREFWDLDITKAELASQLGTAGETLSRTLRKFRDAGWIEVRGRFVKILDREALERVAEGGENGVR